LQGGEIQLLRGVWIQLLLGRATNLVLQVPLPGAAALLVRVP
jgi:hypothetical protein